MLLCFWWAVGVTSLEDNFFFSKVDFLQEVIACVFGRHDIGLGRDDPLVLFKPLVWGVPRRHHHFVDALLVELVKWHRQLGPVE